MHNPGTAFRELLRTEPYLFTGGVYSPLDAQIAERVGMKSIYLSGYSMALASGWPDMGFLTQTEVARIGAMVASAVEIPVIADADDGYGNALSTIRTVQEYVRSGVAGIHIEDQVFPKRCGHFASHEVIPLDEMLGKLAAVLDGRRDPALVVIARTDALGVDGVDAAVERAHAFAEAGADLVFVEAPPSRDVLEALPGRIPAPLVANMVEGGLTPTVSAAELGAMGYRVVLFANTALRVSAAAVRDAFAELRRTGDTRGLADRMLTWEDRQALVGLPEIEALERRYAAGGSPGATEAQGEPTR
jgi:2-methylisocitrate lyase-like PEP mutase family enzyme